MLLANKTAVVYGAGGAIGSAVSRAYAREGARVFLAGRTAAPLDRVASAILSVFGITLAGWIGYLIAGFIGACVLIGVVRVFKKA